jgi:hypothetical protein
VVAAQRKLTPVDHRVEAFLGAGPVAHDVAKAEDGLQHPPVDVGQGSLEGFVVAVNV